MYKWLEEEGRMLGLVDPENPDENSVDSAGIYFVEYNGGPVEGVPVHTTKDRSAGVEVGIVPKGQYVVVAEVAKTSDGRLRGRINYRNQAGWISLRSWRTHQRWARRVTDYEAKMLLAPRFKSARVLELDQIENCIRTPVKDESILTPVKDESIRTPVKDEKLPIDMWEYLVRVAAKIPGTVGISGASYKTK